MSEQRADHLWSMLSRPENEGFSIRKPCCELPQTAHAGIAWGELNAIRDLDDDISDMQLQDAAADLARVQGENERQRAALERAGVDLIGFEGYFERLGSMGTVASIRETLNQIDAALASPTAPQDAEAGVVTLHLCQGTDTRCVPIMRCERGDGHDGQHTAWDGRYSWDDSERPTWLGDVWHAR